MEIIEFWLISIVIIIQLIVFIKTREKIRLLKDAFLPEDKMDITKILGASNNSDIEGKTKIIEEDYFQVISKSRNFIFNQIIYAVNAFFKSSKNKTKDFSIIKNIFDKNVESKEDEIETLLPVPLYLGLAGTMLGIIIGLFGISDFENINAVSPLINGVKIAMIASLVGIVLTTISTSIIYRNAKIRIDKGKEDFYSFIRNKLISQETSDFAGSVMNLNEELRDFKTDFAQNLTKLSTVSERSIIAINAQNSTLEKLEKGDINKLADLARINVKVFRELQKSSEQFEKFNEYVAGLNSFIDKTHSLTKRIDSLDKNFSKIGDNISGRIEEAGKIMDFIDSHFSELEKSREVIQAAVAESNSKVLEQINDSNQKIGMATVQITDYLGKSIESLKEITHKKIQEISQIASSTQLNLVPEFELVANSLNKLDYLEKIFNSFDDYTKKNDRVIASLNENYIALSEKIDNKPNESEKTKKRMSTSPLFFLFMILFLAIGGVGIYTLNNLLNKNQQMYEQIKKIKPEEKNDIKLKYVDFFDKSYSGKIGDENITIIIKDVYLDKFYYDFHSDNIKFSWSGYYDEQGALLYFQKNLTGDKFRDRYLKILSIAELKFVENKIQISSKNNKAWILHEEKYLIKDSLDLN